ATTRGMGVQSLPRLSMKAMMDSAGCPKSTMMQQGACSWSSEWSAWIARAGFTHKPRSRAVPVMRLVKIMSSESNKPMGVVGKDEAAIVPHLSSNGFRTAFTRADANTVFQGQNKDLAVADASLGTGAACLHDSVHCRLDKILIDGNLQLNLSQQVDRQFMAPIDFRVPFLPA